MQSVALLPAAVVIVGAVAGMHVDPAWTQLRWLLPAIWIAAVLAWATCRPRVTVGATAAGFLLASLCLSADATDRARHSTLRAALDAEYGHFAIESMPPGGEHGPLQARARLLEDAAVVDDGVSLRVSIESLFVHGRWRAVEGGVNVSVSGQSAPDRVRAWRAGRTIVVPVQFRRPPRYFDAGVPDGEDDLALAGTTLFASVKSGLLIDVVREGSATEEWAADVRAFVRGAVARRVSPWDAVAGGIVTAILIGDRTGLPDEIRNRLQAAGTYHVIAISGGNIAILASAILMGLTVVCVRGRGAAVFAIVALLAYAEVVSGGPSVSRAIVMAVCYLAARIADHRTPPWHATALAAALIVIVRPLDVRDAGFLLTFGATAALLQAARRAGAILPAQPAVRWLAASLLASAATELALLPVSATVFSRVTAAGLVLNLIAVPVMGVVQIAGMVAVASDRIDVVASPAGWLAYVGAATLVESARLVDAAPWLAARVAPPSIVLVAVYYAALAAAMATRRPRSRRIALVATTVAAGATVYGLAPPDSRVDAGALRLTLFDVGQGDAMLLQWRGHALMVDTGGAPFGGRFDLGVRVLAPALWARGVRTLDALLVTHGDPDHVGGAEAVAGIFAPRQMWFGVRVPANVPTETLLVHAQQAGARVAWRRRDERFEIDGLRLRVLNPPEPDWERRRVRNDDSVVIEATYGDVALLLMGDAGAAIEREIAAELAPARVRILKVGHHGSRTSTSSALLESWHPGIALVSCGRGNTFGHPAVEVIARLESAGARVYRTDRDGEVTVETDGSGVKVNTFLGGNGREPRR
jgi:competence protein ComEC